MERNGKKVRNNQLQLLCHSQKYNKLLENELFVNAASLQKLKSSVQIVHIIRFLFSIHVLKIQSHCCS